MRCLLLAIFLAAAGCAAAQKMPNAGIFKKEPWYQVPGTEFKLDSSSKATIEQLRRGLQPALKKPGVYTLPLDRMPCIVPDTRQIASIPNPGLNFKLLGIGKIPNAKPQPQFPTR